MIKKNALLFLRAPYSVGAFILSSVVMMLIFIQITDYELLRGNFGVKRLHLELIVQAILCVLFGFFIGLNVYRYQFFRATQDHVGTTNTIGSLGAIISTLVIGCPGCGFTLAGALGLVGFLGFLPYGGEELKYIGILFLLLANLVLLKNLRTCKVKKGKR